MKKILSLTMVGTLALMVSSCQKNQPATPADAGTGMHTTAQKYKGTGRYLREKEWDCPAGDGNCLATPIVHGKRKMDWIVESVNNGTFHDLLNTNSDVYAELTLNATELQLSYINGARDGIYNVALDNSSPELNESRALLLFGEGEVTKENCDVIMPLTQE